MTLQRRSILGAVISNTALGWIPAAVGLIFGHPTLKVVLQDALFGFVYSNCIGFPAWWLVPKIFVALRGRAQTVKVGTAVVVLVVCALAGCLVGTAILVGIGQLEFRRAWPVFRETSKICLFITLAFGTLATVIGTLEGRLQSAGEQLKERQLAEERANKMAAEARFASLESRVHPHFLFNTLNSISALVREDPAEAERMIERLAALIRFSLDSELAGLVPLSEELRVTRDYLEIEKVRFGDRLRYSIEPEAGTEGCQVPPLSVQTLVENSVKYAVGVRREGAEIAVRARLVAGELRVEVSDDGPGFDPLQSLKPGHGLDLLQRRLTALFGSAASLGMSSSEGRMRIEITVAA